MNPQPQPNPAPAYQLVFQLKQHTPMLHFQHDQTGATLRATELKPKLDLYIMRKLLLSIGEAALPDHAVREKFKEMAKGKMKEAWLRWLVHAARMSRSPCNTRCMCARSLLTKPWSP